MHNTRACDSIVDIVPRRDGPSVFVRRQGRGGGIAHGRDTYSPDDTTRLLCANRDDIIIVCPPSHNNARINRTRTLAHRTHAYTNNISLGMLRRGGLSSI